MTTYTPHPLTAFSGNAVTYVRPIPRGGISIVVEAAARLSGATEAVIIGKDTIVIQKALPFSNLSDFLVSERLATCAKGRRDLGSGEQNSYGHYFAVWGWLWIYRESFAN
ncbi:MAG TPA: hypothetical protein VHG32_24385, partial [Thermoanaerobaculia bacterium]|nr:hypothetical protein [Thermoanaerobaculia bacterium]